MRKKERHLAGKGNGVPARWRTQATLHSLFPFLPFLRCTVFVSPKERDGVSPPPLSHTHLLKQRHYARAQVLGATSLLNASECLSFVRVFRVNSRANEGKQREGKAIQIIFP